jgi:hypothetical protein
MKFPLLNLISTPMPVLNSLGLNLRVGLSSEDPMVGRQPKEPYDAFLSIYSPEGVLLDRKALGQIEPDRRKFFDVSEITRQLLPGQDHLSVVHRVPSRLLAQVSSVEDSVELEDEPDYSYFRSLVEYSFPGGGNGSVIYETPPRLNLSAETGASSNTLSFTCQTAVSELVSSRVVLIHHSVNPQYTNIAKYSFALFSLSGERVFTDEVSVGPFGIKVLDIRALLPKEVIDRERDPVDGISSFNFVGFSQDAAMMVLAINDAPSLGAVAVEHIHPPQTYLLPWDFAYQKKAKTEAQQAWRSILSSPAVGE